MTLISDTQIRQARQLIQDARAILITTHVRPDGDAIGSAAALRQALQQRHPEKTFDLLLLSPAPDNYLFLLDQPWQTLGLTLPADELADFIARFPLIIVVDTCTVAQMPALGQLLLARPQSTIVIDHHLSRDENLSHCAIVNTSVAAAGQIVLEFIQKLSISLTPLIAEALFTALACDTGWFRFENTTPDCFESAAALAQTGFSIEQLYQKLFQNFPFERTRLIASALNAIELYADGSIALMTITNAMLAQSGAKRPHIENIVNECQNIATVQTWALLVEQKDPAATRCSLRSRGSGIDVNRIARRFQGGGHARAAGLTLNEPIAQAKQTILAALLESQPNRTV